MTDRPSFDPFEQRIAAEFERYVQPATDPKPISAIVGAAMRPRGLAVRFRNQSRPRRFLLLGIAAAFLVPATYLAAGSLQPPTADPSVRLPAPFGPARNGLIATSINGDIVTVDPATGTQTVIITGPEMDADPIFSSLGTQILFFRTAPGQAQHGMGDAFFMADADGSSVRQLLSGTTGPGQHSPWLPWFDLTADGRRLIYVTCCGDGSTGSPQILDTVTGATTTALTGSAKSPLPAAFTGSAMWRPGHDEYVFTGLESGRTGLYVAPADGSAAQAIAIPEGGFSEWGLSPDGSRIVYVQGDGPGPLHIIDIDTGQDRLLTQPGDGYVWSNPQFSPDGTQILAERYPAPAPGSSDIVLGKYSPVLLPVDGAGPVVELGAYDACCDGDSARMQFSPDGTEVLVYFIGDETSWILDTTGGPARQLDWPYLGGDWAYRSGSAWQRLAP